MIEAQPHSKQPAPTRGRSARRVIKSQVRFLTFVDILGFKSLVEQAQSDPELALRIEAAVAEALYWVKGCKPHPTGNYAWQLRTFSDCITCSQPDTTLGLLNMFEAVAYLIRRVIYRHLPVRGGITIGDHIQLQLTIPSAALVDAYRLEQTAVHPRIALSHKITDFITQRSQDDLAIDLCQYVVFDQDGKAFLHHLVCDEDDEMHSSTQYVLAERDMLLNELGNSSLAEAVREKYIWLAAFHDWCVRSSNWHVTEEEIMNELELCTNRDDGGKYLFLSLWHVFNTLNPRAKEMFGEVGHQLRKRDIMKPAKWPFNRKGSSASVIDGGIVSDLEMEVR